MSKSEFAKPFAGKELDREFNPFSSLTPVQKVRDAHFDCIINGRPVTELCSIDEFRKRAYFAIHGEWIGDYHPLEAAKEIVNV